MHFSLLTRLDLVKKKKKRLTDLGAGAVLTVGRSKSHRVILVIDICDKSFVSSTQPFRWLSWFTPSCANRPLLWWQQRGGSHTRNGELLIFVTNAVVTHSDIRLNASLFIGILCMFSSTPHVSEFVIHTHKTSVNFPNEVILLPLTDEFF